MPKPNAVNVRNLKMGKPAGLARSAAENARARKRMTGFEAQCGITMDEFMRDQAKQRERVMERWGR